MTDAAIHIRGLHKRYGATVALRHLDLDIPRGTVFGLLGPNGAGKSTTFGILCGWLRATAGSATVLGVGSGHLHTLRGRVAALPQDASFPPQIPVRAQLAHYARLGGMRGRDALREADRVLEAVGLSASAGARGSELSHGMLKRIGLAQALIGAPEVIFLDEPTAGLDPKSARAVKDRIASLAPAATVVLSSHNLVDVQEICTHGAILDRGNLVVAGTIDVLTRRGAEVTITLRAGPDLDEPIGTLRERFGDANVELRGERLRILFAPERDAAEVIGAALRILLDAGAPILGVQRGTSLETAFLQATSGGPGTGGAPPPQRQ